MQPASRIAWALVWLLAPVLAREPDGAVAGPLRWYDPRGTASGSRRSLALPVTRGLEEAWSREFGEHRVEAPPVIWEGRVYLLVGLPGSRSLVALDLLTGERIARKPLPGPAALAVVWDHRVYLRAKEDELAAYQVAGRSFKRVWRFRPKAPVKSDPVVIDGEVYVYVGDDLVKVRLGHDRPVWRAPLGASRGRPAVYGDHVYSVHETSQDPPSIRLTAFSRRTGAMAATVEVAWYAGGQRSPAEAPCEITVLEDRVYIRSPRPLAAGGGASAGMTHAGVSRRASDRHLYLGAPVRLYKLGASPAAHRDGLLALTDDQHLMWVLWRGETGVVLARYSTEQADLFHHRISPTVLGDVAYFGDWAADVRTLDVLWRLPVSNPRYPVVPADRMILVVDGNRLRAFRERGTGR